MTTLASRGRLARGRVMMRRLMLWWVKTGEDPVEGWWASYNTATEGWKVSGHKTEAEALADLSSLVNGGSDGQD